MERFISVNIRRYQSAGGVEEQVVDVGAPEFDLVAPAGAFDGLYAAVERQAPDLFISLRRQKFLHYFLREGFGVTCINLGPLAGAVKFDVGAVGEVHFKGAVVKFLLDLLDDALREIGVKKIGCFAGEASGGYAAAYGRSDAGGCPITGVSPSSPEWYGVP